MTKIPVLNLRAEHEPIRERLHQAFDQILDSSNFILGDAVRDFEQQCTDFLGIKNAIGVSSGSDALLLALMALGIGPGDEVLVPSFSFFATAGCVVRLGAKPIFVDVNPRTFNMEPSAVSAALTPQTKAIIVVHLFGQCADLQAIENAADGRPIVEDAAQAFGATYREKRAGTIETLGCFSFFPSKNLGGFGDGGMVVTHDDDLAHHIRRLRVHGAKEKYFHEEVGGNHRLDALQAAFLSVKLEILDAQLRKRKQLANVYRKHLQKLEGHLTLPEDSHGGHSWNQFTIRLEGRDQLQAFLQDKFISSMIYYPRSLHNQPCFMPNNATAPVSEQLESEVLSLPIGPHLSDADVEQVCDAITAFFTKDKNQPA